MSPRNLTLGIHDGILCVCSEMTDWHKPIWIKSYWPTKIRAREFFSYFGCTEADLPRFSVRQTFPGEYYVSHWDHYHNGQYVSLTNGGQTQPINTTQRPYEIKTRCKKEYRDGNWQVCRAGRWQNV